MKTIKLKTTINCGGCVAAVTPTLNGWKEIKSWKVDVNDPNKVLTIESETLNENEVIEKLKSIGYKGESI